MKRTNCIPFLLALCCTVSMAETSGPIQIEADRMELDQQKGISLYQGHVRLQRGNTLLQAERVELHSRDGKINQAIADGAPVHLEMQDPQSGQITRGEASHVEYRLDEGLLELQGTAQLWRDGDHFSGERLLYNDHKQQVSAFGNDRKNGRVQVILQPEKEAQQ